MNGLSLFIYHAWEEAILLPITPPAPIRRDREWDDWGRVSRTHVITVIVLSANFITLFFSLTCHFNTSPVFLCCIQPAYLTGCKAPYTYTQEASTHFYAQEVFQWGSECLTYATSSPGLFPPKHFLREKPWGRGCNLRPPPHCFTNEVFFTPQASQRLFITD